MPLLFSPVDNAELSGPFEPRPRTAFIMLQISANVPEDDAWMAGEVKSTLTSLGFRSVTAADVRGTGDFLSKIVNLIRGCGFAIAIFSDRTPPKTLANIFFEIGIAGVLGKPVQLVLTGDNPAPSDFVRTEWIAYVPGQPNEFRSNLQESLARINASMTFYRAIAEVAMEAENPDLELAFERYRQAVLIGNDPESLAGIGRIRQSLILARRREGHDDMASHRERLHTAVIEFLRLCPLP